MHGETTAANPPGQGNLRGDVEARHSGDPGSACNEAGNHRSRWVASESKQRRCERGTETGNRNEGIGSLLFPEPAQEERAADG
jgi:hypothetical protein